MSMIGTPADSETPGAPNGTVEFREAKLLGRGRRGVRQNSGKLKIDPDLLYKPPMEWLPNPLLMLATTRRRLSGGRWT